MMQPKDREVKLSGAGSLWDGVSQPSFNILGITIPLGKLIRSTVLGGLYRKREGGEGKWNSEHTD